MRGNPRCPRCSGALHPPGLWSSDWVCDQHGPVAPLQPIGQPSSDVAHAVADSASVPVWLPWPLPRGWLVTGVASAGDERTGARATALACSGPAPLGGVAEVILVAEEPGVGLAARYAGLTGPDPGAIPDDRPCDAKITAAGHPTALWAWEGAANDRSVYVGEALGCWLWVVAWPDSAGFLLVDDFTLLDLRGTGHELDIPCGALSPRLT